MLAIHVQRPRLQGEVTCRPSMRRLLPRTEHLEPDVLRCVVIRVDLVTALVNYPALLAPSRLAAVGHSLRAGLYRNDIVPRNPMQGRGPASSSRPRADGGSELLLRPAYRIRSVDCPADLIPGVLSLYPNTGDGDRTRSRSSFPSIGCDGHAVAPREPVYSWLLPTPACARTAVSHITGGDGLILAVSSSFATRFLSTLLAPVGRSLRKEAPRYRLLTPELRLRRPVLPKRRPTL